MTKKNYLKRFFQFSSSVLPTLPTPTYKNFIQKGCLVGERHFFERHSVSKLYILFLKSFLCTPLMNHTKTINTFLMRTKINDKKFLQKMIFLFYHRPSVTSLITMSLEKIYMKKIFMKLFFPKYNFFNCYHQSCVFHWYITPTLQNFFVKVSIYEKN